MIKVAKNENILMCLQFVSTNVLSCSPPLLFIVQGQQSHRMVIFLAIFILMTIFILYNSNTSTEAVYTPFHVATNHALKTTDLKKWTGKEGYVSFYGNKVLDSLHTNAWQTLMV